MPPRGLNRNPPPPNPNRYTHAGLLVAPNIIQRAINRALSQRGQPYQWGGIAPRTGFDCSGLVYWAYRQAGYEGIGRDTYSQIRQGRPVGIANLRPGDVVFPSREHEGLYIGNGRVLEAPHTGDVVKVVPLSQFGFMTARRLLGGGGGVIPPRAGLGAVTQNGLPVPHPSVNPQAFHNFMQHQQAQAQRQMKAFQTQMTQQAAQQSKAMAQQFAKQRQQNLSSQIQAEAQQRVGAAQTAQRGLTAGVGGVVSSDPATALGAQRKTALEDVHARALKSVGV